MIITSVQNEKVKNWVKLKEKKARDFTNTYFIEGDHLLKEALKKNVVLEIISLNEELYDDIPCYQVTEGILKKLTSQVTTPNIMAVCKKQKREKIEGPVVLLDGIQDPGNLGTIIRSAVAFSIPNILLSLDTVDLYNPKVIRSTEGMHFHINIIRQDLVDSIQTLKNEGYTIYTTNVHEGKDLADLKFPMKTAFLIGSEGSGVKKGLENLAHDSLKIPMNERCESLNAAVSTSIILYEYRKEWKK